MEIKLKNKQPVQKTYTGIPSPLFTEVKHCIEDLLNRQ